MIEKVAPRSYFDNVVAHTSLYSQSKLPTYLRVQISI